MDSLLLDADDVANLLKVGRSSVYQMLADGRLRGVKIGRSRRFTREEIDQFVQRLRTEASAVGQ